MKTLKFTKGKKFTDIFPNVKNYAALDLLSKLLEFNPEKRITVDEALEHDYLKDLHDPEDEPKGDSFDFTFESFVTPQTIRSEIIKKFFFFFLNFDRNVI